MTIQRFTAYRRNLSERGTHNHYQANPDDAPQFEGVIFTDGSVAIRWLTACSSTSIWKNIDDALNIHGHPEYGTVIEWHDGDAPQVWQDKCYLYAKSIKVVEPEITLYDYGDDDMGNPWKAAGATD